MTNAPVEPTPDSGDVLPSAAPENGAPNEETAGHATEVTDTPAPVEAAEANASADAPADAELADGLALLGAADAAADGQPTALDEPSADVEDDFEEEPPEPDRNWFEKVPSTWDEWTELQTQVAESLRVRESFRNWMMNHLDEDARPMVAGLGRFASGEYTKAVPHLEKAGGELAQLLCGQAQRSLGNVDAAASCFGAVTGNSALAVRARACLVDMRLSERDEQAVAGAVDAVRKAGDGPADLAFAEGALAEVNGDHDAALESWGRALEENDTHVEATFRLAELLDLHGDDDTAMELYCRFLTGQLPPHAGALINLGMLHADRDEHDWAAVCFNLVQAAEPTNKRAYRHKIDATASLGQYYDESRERHADKQNAVLRTPVTDFELSVRARNCLQRMELHTLGDLVCRTESELLSFKNFGETSLQEVKDILMMKGLRLGMRTTSQAEEPASSETPNPGDMTETPISELDLSVRSRTALSMLGINTVRELTQTSEVTLMSCKNFGQTSLDEVRSKLRNMGLELAT